MVVRAVRQRIAERGLFAVQAGSREDRRHATRTSEVVVSDARVHQYHGVTHHIVESAPVRVIRATAVRVVHENAVDQHVGVFRVESTDTEPSCAEVICRDTVERVTCRLQETRDIRRALRIVIFRLNHDDCGQCGVFVFDSVIQHCDVFHQLCIQFQAECRNQN